MSCIYWEKDTKQPTPVNMVAFQRILTISPFWELATATLEPKVAVYKNPIIAAQYYWGKDETNRGYVRTHVFFQSTDGKNISSVNALSEVDLYG